MIFRRVFLSQTAAFGASAFASSFAASGAQAARASGLVALSGKTFDLSVARA